MSNTGWTPVAAQTPPQASGWTPVQESQPSFTDKAENAVKIAWNMLPGIGDIHSIAGAVQDWAAKKMQESGTFTSPAKTFGYGALADTANIAKGATSMQGAGIAAAGILAPEIVGPAMLAHGSYKMAKQPWSTNPQDVQNQLLNASEAVGGAAATGQALQGSGTTTQYVKNKIVDRSIPSEKLNEAPPVGQMQPALDNTPQEVLNYAKNKGIDLTPGQATQTPVSRTIEAMGERSLWGGDRLADAKTENAMKLAKNVSSLADKVDPYALGISEEQAGETAQLTTKVAQDIARENASYSYKDLPPQLTQQPVDVSPVRAKYFQQLKQAEVSLANRSPAIASQVRGVLEQGANLGTPAEGVNGQPYMRPELNFSDLMKVRSDALQDGDAMARAGAPTEVQGLYRGLAKDVDSLMESTAQKQGYLNEWRNANAGWRDYQTKYNNPQSPLYRILNQGDPARVTRNILNNGSAADIELLNKEGMQPTLDALKRQAITDIANRGFKVTGDGLGGYSDSFLNQLFGREVTKELYLNGELARRFGFQLNPSGTSNVMMGEYQLHAEPSRWMLLRGAAEYSMPRPAGNFLRSPQTGIRALPSPVPALVGAGTISNEAKGEQGE